MKTTTFKQAIRWIILASLLLAAACAGGEVETYRPSSYPAYSRPYYPDYYGPSYYPESDPEFWQMQQDRSGGP